MPWLLRGPVNDVWVEQQDFRLLTLSEIELDPHMCGWLTPDLDDSAVGLIESPRDDDSVSDVQGLALLYHGAAPLGPEEDPTRSSPAPCSSD